MNWRFITYIEKVPRILINAKYTNMFSKASVGMTNNLINTVTGTD